MACLAESERHKSGLIEVRAPSQIESANYASRMGLGEHIADHCGAENTFPITRRNKTRSLSELRRYQTEDDADDLVIEVDECLRNAGLRPGERQPVLEILEEVAQNSIEHSGTSVGYFAAQTYGHANHDLRVAFAVGDFGIGIRESFSGTDYESNDDLEAILSASQLGVSRHGDPNRGKGLPFSIGHKGVAGSGRFTVRSGRATVSFSSANATPRERNWLPGTLITALVDC